MGKSICNFENRVVVKVDFATKETFLGSSPYFVPTWKGLTKKYTSQISVRVCRHLPDQHQRRDYVQVAQVPKLSFNASGDTLLPKPLVHTFNVAQYSWSQMAVPGFEAEALEGVLFISERPIVTTERTYVKYPATWWDAVKQELSKFAWMSWLKFNLADYPHEVRYVRECTTPDACFYFLSGISEPTEKNGARSSKIHPGDKRIH